MLGKNSLSQMNWSARGIKCIESVFEEHFNWNDSNNNTK